MTKRVLILLTLLLWSATAAHGSACCTPDCVTAGSACQTPFPAYPSPSVTPCVANYAYCADSSCVATGPTLTPTPANVPAPDWSDHFVAVWRFNSSITANDTSTSCGSTCDLTNVNTVTSDASVKKEGSAADTFVATSSQELTSAAAALYASGSVTAGCWLYRTTAADGGMGLFRRNAWPQLWSCGTNTYHTPSYAFACLDNTSGTIYSNTGIPLSTWQHAVVRIDVTGDTLKLFQDGTQTGTGATTTTGVWGTDPQLFHLGANGTNYWTGNLDECFYYAGALTAPSICRIHACGIDGSGCLCNGTSYYTFGNNSSATAPCDMSAIACNAGAPATE